MAIQSYLWLTLLLVLGESFCRVASSDPSVLSNETASLNRRSFPPGFLFGASSSAYQYEGAAFEGGRGPSIWDTFTHEHPEKIVDHSNGDVAVDSYHRYKEDVQIIKDIGFDTYRFSISWSRILPKGKPSEGVNEEGIQYYNNLINELLKNGIHPFVTLFHWDLPQALENEYGGFRSPKILEDFVSYAEICFKTFGDRVKHWLTLNEPAMFAAAGYAAGWQAPGRCSPTMKNPCAAGDSGTEPYLVTHHELLAHAHTVKLYRTQFQATQKGQIGITLNTNWFEPLTNSEKDRKATNRAFDFQFGWFMNPIANGRYPHTMRALVKHRLPKFTKKDSEILIGSLDFLGLNYYTASYISDLSDSHTGNPSYLTDARINQTTQRNGIPIGPQGGSPWLCIYPRGIYDLLLYIKNTYNSPVIYITENGIDEVHNATIPLKEALIDNRRIDYHSQHLSFVQKAIKDGVNVKGYMVWTLLDDFERISGYTSRFGLNYIDFNDGQKRYPKSSVQWFKNFLKK